jgi:HSP20 family protein
MELRNLIPWHRDRETIAVRRDAEPMFALQDRLNRMFDDFFRGVGISPWSTGTAGLTIPSVDVSETAEEIRVEAELPGVDEKDIQLTLTDEILTIAGEKQSEERTEQQDYHHVERSWGSFRRTVKLPCEVVADRASASFRKGVLTVRLPKKEPSAANVRKIPVRSEP